MEYPDQLDARSTRPFTRRLICNIVSVSFTHHHSLERIYLSVPFLCISCSHFLHFRTMSDSVHFKLTVNGDARRWGLSTISFNWITTSTYHPITLKLFRFALPRSHLSLLTAVKERVAEFTGATVEGVKLAWRGMHPRRRNESYPVGQQHFPSLEELGF